MDYTQYNLYGIDAADIWQYERDCYLAGKQEGKDKDSIKELYKFLQQFYLAAKIKPFIESSSDESFWAEGYRKEYKELESGAVCLDFFFCAGKAYRLLDSCEVFIRGYNDLKFQRLFILKLRQYRDGLSHVEDFMRYQLNRNFKNKLSVFQKFLKLSLLQYPGVVASPITTVIDEWFLEIEKKKSTKAAKPKAKRNKVLLDSEEKKREAINGDAVLNSPAILKADDEKQIALDESSTASQQIISKSERLDEPIVENSLVEPKEEPIVVAKLNESPKEDSTAPLPPESETEDTLPEGYEPIRGNFTKKEEIIHFFSFLHKEKSKDGQTFLQENDVTEIFKYGLAIPPAIPDKKYTLNCSLKFPKSIVEFCIYRFVGYHTTSHNKRKVLIFFANYITDFEKNISDQITLEKWSNNVTGERPGKMKFALTDYLPDRLKDQA